MTRTEKALWILLVAGIVVGFWLTLASVVCAQETIEVDIKAIQTKVDTDRPLVVGPVRCTAPLYAPVDNSGKQYRVVSDSKMAEIAKDNVEEAVLAEQVGVVSLSTILMKTSSKTTIKPVEVVK